MRGTSHFIAFSGLAILALVPGHAQAAASCAPLSVITTMPLQMLPSGLVSVPVLIGDKPEILAVDVGGLFSGLTPKTVMDLNLTPIDSGVRVGGSKAKGPPTKQVKLPSITLGQIRQDGPFFTVEQGNPNRELDHAGTLAGDVLSRTDIDLDYGGGKINLISQNHCDGQVVYWPNSGVAVIPFTVDANRNIQFQVTLDDQKILAEFDTVYADTLVDLDKARSWFSIDVSAPDVKKLDDAVPDAGAGGRGGRGGAARPRYSRQFKSISFGNGVAVANPTVIMQLDMVPRQTQVGTIENDTNAGLPLMRVGNSVLSKLHVYVAYKERKLYITQAAPTS